MECAGVVGREPASCWKIMLGVVSPRSPMCIGRCTAGPVVRFIQVCPVVLCCCLPQLCPRVPCCPYPIPQPSILGFAQTQHYPVISMSLVTMICTILIPATIMMPVTITMLGRREIRWAKWRALGARAGLHLGLGGEDPDRDVSLRGYRGLALHTWVSRPTAPLGRRI